MLYGVFLIPSDSAVAPHVGEILGSLISIRNETMDVRTIYYTLRSTSFFPIMHRATTLPR